MSKVFILLMLTFGKPCFAGILSIEKVRTLYQKAVSDEKDCKELITLLKPYNVDNNPLFSGYKAGATMMMAKYSFSPFSKLSYFKKGKKLLEKAIAADQNNIELRFLRFGAQTNTPSFLAYNDNIETDKSFLLESIAYVTDISLRKIIIKFLRNSSYLTAKQKQELPIT